LINQLSQGKILNKITIFFIKQKATNFVKVSDK
jgi:hypothetical protein